MSISIIERLEKYFEDRVLNEQELKELNNLKDNHELDDRKLNNYITETNLFKGYQNLSRLFSKSKIIEFQNRANSYPDGIFGPNTFLAMLKEGVEFPGKYYIIKGNEENINETIINNIFENNENIDIEGITKKIDYEFQDGDLVLYDEELGKIEIYRNGKKIKKINILYETKLNSEELEEIKEGVFEMSNGNIKYVYNSNDPNINSKTLWSIISYITDGDVLMLATLPDLYDIEEGMEFIIDPKNYQIFGNGKLMNNPNKISGFYTIKNIRNKIMNLKIEEGWMKGPYPFKYDIDSRNFYLIIEKGDTQLSIGFDSNLNFVEDKIILNGTIYRLYIEEGILKIESDEYKIPVPGRKPVITQNNNYETNGENETYKDQTEIVEDNDINYSLPIYESDNTEFYETSVDKNNGNLTHYDYKSSITTINGIPIPGRKPNIVEDNNEIETLVATIDEREIVSIDNDEQYTPYRWEGDFDQYTYTEPTTENIDETNSPEWLKNIEVGNGREIENKLGIIETNMYGIKRYKISFSKGDNVVQIIFGFNGEIDYGYMEDTFGYGTQNFGELGHIIISKKGNIIEISTKFENNENIDADNTENEFIEHTVRKGEWLLNIIRNIPCDVIYLDNKKNLYNQVEAVSVSSPIKTTIEVGDNIKINTNFTEIFINDNLIAKIESTIKDIDVNKTEGIGVPIPIRKPELDEISNENGVEYMLLHDNDAEYTLPSYHSDNTESYETTLEVNNSEDREDDAGTEDVLLQDNDTEYTLPSYESDNTELYELEEKEINELQYSVTKYNSTVNKGEGVVDVLNKLDIPNNLKENLKILIREIILNYRKNPSNFLLELGDTVGINSNASKLIINGEEIVSINGLNNDSNNIDSSSEGEKTEQTIEIDSGDSEYETKELGGIERGYVLLMELDKSERFKLITVESSLGYFRIDYSVIKEKYNITNREIAYINKEIRLGDLMDDKYNSCEVLRNSYSGRGVNYYDMAFRNDEGEFQYESSFKNISGNQYNRNIIVSEGYFIRPREISYDELVPGSIFSQENFSEGEISEVEYGNFNVNERIIKTLFGDYIKDIIGENIGNSVIDESLIYAVISQESKFDPNSVSSRGVRGLMQTVMSTSAEILYKNEQEIARLIEENGKEIENNDQLQEFLRRNFDLTDALVIGNQINAVKRVTEDRRYLYILSNTSNTTELFTPETSINIGINYLRNIEQHCINTIGENWNNYSERFKREVILATYNAGLNIPLVLQRNPSINNFELLKNQIISDVRKGVIDEKHFGSHKRAEMIGYINRINRYLELNS